MTHRHVMAVIGTLLAFAVTAGPASAQAVVVTDTSQRTVSATGVGFVKPELTDRQSNRSIAEAVQAAQGPALDAAVLAAQVRAQRLAAAAGSTLGELISVQEPGGWEGEDFGVFGPRKFCGVHKRPIFRRDKNGRRRVVAIPESASVTFPSESRRACW